MFFVFSRFRNSSETRGKCVSVVIFLVVVFGGRRVEIRWYSLRKIFCFALTTVLKKIVALLDNILRSFNFNYWRI